MAYVSYPSTTVTAGGSVGLKGAYAEIVAATPFDASRLYVFLRNSSAANRGFLLDLATGAVGVETVLISNLAWYGDTESHGGGVAILTADVPSGTRLTARCQSSNASAPLSLGLLLEDRSLTGLSLPVTYGADTGNTRGTLVDPGTTINTKGAYVALTTATTAALDALVLCITLQTATTVIAGFSSWLIDIATGAGGAETVVIPDVPVSANSFGDSVRTPIVRFPVAIPSGTRLAVRCQSNINTAVRVLAITAIGMQEPATGGSAAGAVAYVG